MQSLRKTAKIRGDRTGSGVNAVRMATERRVPDKHLSRGYKPLGIRLPPCWSIKRLLLGLACVLIIGCDGTGGRDAPRRLRMGHVYEVKSPTHHFGASHLNDRLQAAGIDLELAVFPASQLGSESELLEQLVAGELDLAIAGPSFLAMWHPPLGIFDAAYAFRDMEHMMQVADGPVMKPEWDELRNRFGIRVLASWAYGSRHITGNRPIRHPNDLRGFRLRMPAAAIWQASGKSLGASPMPIPFSEVYMALQQGIADGQENPVPVIYAMGFHEVQRYLSMTGHIQASIQVLVNEQVWQSLTDRQRQVMQQAILDLGEDVLVGTEKQEAELLQQWRSDETLQVIEDVDIAAFERQARQYFSDNFPFSSLYRDIVDDRSQPQVTAPGFSEQAPPATPATSSLRTNE